jgi:hypothetical protein
MLMSLLLANIPFIKLLKFKRKTKKLLKKFEIKIKIKEVIQKNKKIQTGFSSSFFVHLFF